jgi:YVTN family beta-propeller protein
MGIALSRDGQRIYVSTGRGGSVAQLAASPPRVERVIAAVGARPWGIALSPDGERLYTANGSSNDLGILELRSGRLQHVDVGGSPWGVVSTLH